MKNAAPARRSILDNPVAVIVPAARSKQYGHPSALKLGGGLTLVEDQMEKILKAFPNSQRYYVAGEYFPDIANLRIVENNDYKITGTGRSIGLALQASIEKAALIIMGNLFISEEILHRLKDVKTAQSTVFTTTAPRYCKDVGVSVNDGRVNGFFFGLNRLWLQIVYLTGQELILFKELSNFPANRTLLAFEVLDKVIAEGGELKEFSIEDCADLVWLIEKSDDVKKLKGIL